MEETSSTEAVQINLETWERGPLYELFSGFSEPFHGVCLRVDCTETFRYAKDTRISVFLTLLHRSLIAVHQVENFMTRIVGGAVWKYTTIHGGSAVGRPNGTIGFGHYSYQPELIAFVQKASLELERVKNRNDLERYAGQDLVRFSILPWFDFTSVSHARNLGTQDSAPKITFGKITEVSGRCTMPVSIHVHHALRTARMWLNLLSSSNGTWQPRSYVDVGARCLCCRFTSPVSTHKRQGDPNPTPNPPVRFP